VSDKKEERCGRKQWWNAHYRRRWKETIMNTQPLELETHVENVITETIAETELLIENGFTSDEIVSLLWLRQWYQNGGSDRIEVVRHLEFIKLLVLNGKIDL
jgi:hypothetical protein